jgi:NADPH-dependent 2,4-dienoyl-CoA reductase/sulfur reductase-like enzyme
VRYVIAGTGPAGLIAAETLRNANPDGEVALLSAEPEPPYARMALPYLLTGQVNEAGTLLRRSGTNFTDLGIEFHYAGAKSVAPDTGQVTLSNGDTMAFDMLLVATGASAIKPDVPGLGGRHVCHCWTMADARKIMDMTPSGADVVLMGAGFIGCIIMEALASRGVNLTVVEAEGRVLPRMMNETGANMIKRWCEGKGIRVLTSSRVMALEPLADGDGNWVVLEDGEKIKANLTVVATGVKSNTEFLDGSGVKVDQGVVVDENLRSNVETIFAAGDAAQGPDFSTGGWNVHAIQPTAADHGRIAALNMAGRPAAYKGSLIMNVLDTVGLVSCSFGEWDGSDAAELVDEDAYRYTRLAFEGDVLVGALCLGRTENIGVMRGLIQSQTRLGDWKQRLIADPNRVMDAFVALLA